MGGPASNSEKISVVDNKISFAGNWLIGCLIDIYQCFFSSNF